jgi:hypothetical protein
MRGRLRASSLLRRPTWGDCRQCPLTAALQRAGVPRLHSASVANRSVTCPTRKTESGAIRGVLNCSLLIGHREEPDS